MRRIKILNEINSAKGSRRMTKTIPLILALSVSSLFAGYNMAFAKATRDISLGSQSTTVRYLMDDKLKGYFEPALTQSLSENNMSVGTGKEITIVPILMGSYYGLTKAKKLLPRSKPLSEINAFIKKAETDSNTSVSGANAKGLAGNFVHGFISYGSQGAASTLKGSLLNMGTAGLFSLGFAVAFNGINMLSTASDQYLMVSDVYFGEEHTRIFAFVYSFSVSEKEAAEKLTELTAQKIAQLAHNGGQQ